MQEDINEFILYGMNYKFYIETIAFNVELKYFLYYIGYAVTVVPIFPSFPTPHWVEWEKSIQPVELLLATVDEK